MENKHIHLILLAAGNSRRFGSNKLFYKWKGIFLYQNAIKILETTAYFLQKHIGENDSWKVDIYVVSRYKEVEEWLTKQGSAIFVFGKNSEAGISESIRSGIEEAKTRQEEWEENYYLFQVADQPNLRAESVASLIKETVKSGKGIGSLCCEHSFGNPVLFRENYIPELLELKGDKGGRTIVKKHEEDCFYYMVNEIELQDIDFLPQQEEK